MSVRGLELAASSGTDILSLAVPHLLVDDPEKELSNRALFLVKPSLPSTPTERSEYVERLQWIRKTNFNRRSGTMLLELYAKKLPLRLIGQPQLDELLEYGFMPKTDPHITVLNYNNGRRITKALSEHRKRPGAVEKEAAKIDWSWRPTGRYYPFEGRRGGNLKIVALVDCPGAEVFYDCLEDGLPNLKLERHPMHITLMKKPGELKNYSNAVIGSLAIGRPLHTLDHLSI